MTFIHTTTCSFRRLDDGRHVADLHLTDCGVHIRPTTETETEKILLISLGIKPEHVPTTKTLRRLTTSVLRRSWAGIDVTELPSIDDDETADDDIEEPEPP